MIELRKAQRPNVNWRCGIKMPDGRILLVKAVNVSAEGLVVLSTEQLQISHVYPVMLEVPDIQEGLDLSLVNCHGLIRHAILAEGSYRCNVHLRELSGLHRELLNAWVSKANRK